MSSRVCVIVVCCELATLRHSVISDIRIQRVRGLKLQSDLVDNGLELSSEISVVSVIGDSELSLCEISASAL